MTSRGASGASARRASVALAAVAALLFAAAASARGVYQTPEAFVREVYAGDPPAPRLLWLTKELQAEAAHILGHDYPAARLRYWLRDERSAWILEEIGKEKPITVGIVIDGGKIELVRVLIFRESRGDEVRHPFFTDQYKGAALRSDRELDRPIDGITGATLSVRALTRLARLALFLHDEAAR